MSDKRDPRFLSNDELLAQGHLKSHLGQRELQAERNELTRRAREEQSVKREIRPIRLDITILLFVSVGFKAAGWLELVGFPLMAWYFSSQVLLGGRDFVLLSTATGLIVGVLTSLSCFASAYIIHLLRVLDYNTRVINQRMNKQE